MTDTQKAAMEAALEALENVQITGPDDDGVLWINLPGNGTTGKAILRVGKEGLIAAQCAKMFEAARSEAVAASRAALAETEEPVQEPYGRVTVVRRPGCVDQHWFYRWPEIPYLDNAAECHTVYTAPQPPAPAVKVTDDMKTVLTFLLGEGPLDGTHFGDERAGANRYWWRKNLRAAIAAHEAKKGQP